MTAAPQTERSVHIDALRGFALFGILVVNLMSFSNGLSGASLGAITPQSSTADRIMVILVAFLAEFKFYPIFAFLFGYGFLQFWQRARARGADAGTLYNRRIWFLGLLGVFHGIFIWFGDILSRYALVAIFLKMHLHHRPRQLLRSMRAWFIAAFLIAAVFAALGLAGGAPASPSDAPMPASIYPTGSYVEATLQRLQDYGAITLYFMFLIPQVMVIFLAGVLAGRMGWLTRPARHRAFWRRLLVIGLAAGLPASAGWTALQWQNAHAFSAAWTAWMPLLDLAMPLQSAAMIAAFLLLLERPVMQRIVYALAPAGRMPLTNYLTQSVVCAFVLYGYGLGLGDDLRQAGLAGLAIGLYALQIVFSHAWLSRHDAGPLEAWWRRVVYRPAKG